MAVEKVQARNIEVGDMLVDHDGERSRVKTVHLSGGILRWQTALWGRMARDPDEYVRRLVRVERVEQAA